MVVVVVALVKVLIRAGTIQLSSDTIRIVIHAMRYNTYHYILAPIQQHLEALFL